MAGILIIDDDRRIRRLLVRILAGVGHKVHEAEDGRKGLMLLHQIKPSLVITDIFMPEVEGLEIIRTIRNEAPDTPIVAISGEGNLTYLRAAKGFGAFAALEKPFEVDELLRVVSDLLKTGGRWSEGTST
jgi:DNA-binding NtrC family response regulator